MTPPFIQPYSFFRNNFEANLDSSNVARKNIAETFFLATFDESKFASKLLQTTNTKMRIFRMEKCKSFESNILHKYRFKSKFASKLLHCKSDMVKVSNQTFYTNIVASDMVKVSS